MSKEWLKKQMMKNKPKKVENVYIKENNEIKINTNIKEKEEKIEMNKIMTVAIDAGKGYTKCVTNKPEIIERNGKKVEKDNWTTDIEMSTIEKGEADLGSTIYIKNKGEKEYSAYNFNTRKKVVENSDKSKNNAEHQALMQRALYKVAKREGVTDFDVVMCISLDQFRLQDNIDKMQENMNVGEFTIKEDGKETTIRIHNLVIEPESIVATRYAKKTKLADSNVVLVDIGTLNIGIAPIDHGKLIKEDVVAPRNGYDYMIDRFKEYSDSRNFDYKKSMLEIYVDEHQGSGHKLDEVFKDFFRDIYSPIIKEKISEKGFGEFSRLVFMGGTSIKCKGVIEENFSKDYLGVDVIEDIFATVKGAYKKGVKDIEKMKQI